MSLSLKKVVKVGILLGLASCAGLECDQQKQKAIEKMNSGITHLQQGRVSEAIKDLELALSLDPKSSKIAFNLGQAHLQSIASGQLGKLTDDECIAKTECKQAWEKAAGAFETAAKNDSSVAMYFYRTGESYYRAGNFQPALTNLQKAVELEKKLFKAHWYIGRIHARQDNQKEAAMAWSESARLNPSFGKPFIDLGRLYYKWDYYAEAVKVLEQGSLNAKAGEIEDRTNLFYELGMAYDAMAANEQPPNPKSPFYDKAIEAYKNAITEKPDNTDARFQIGFTYANKGDKANAKKYLDEYVKTAGNNELTASQVYAANARLLKLVME